MFAFVFVLRDFKIFKKCENDDFQNLSPPTFLNQSSNLSKHKKIHTGEKPFKCSVCLKAFRRLSHLNQHQKIHSGVESNKCTTCNKSFTQSSSLYRHQKIHTDVKSYKCCVCVKAFHQSSNLYKHQKIHSGVKPFKCSVCLKGLNSSFFLTAEPCLDLKHFHSGHHLVNFKLSRITKSKVQN
uniref:C2H2-type domain-containing protein n=1 Tax=Eptatretus burgeri TaxID=7764 RepID=A0A8C4RCI6_EPTBU